MKTNTVPKQKINAKILTVLITFGLFLPMNANGAETAGVIFDKTYSDEGVDMALQGTGLKSMVFFKAFVAGFYRDNQSSENDLGEYSKRIEVEYFVNIPGKKLNKFTIDTMKDNITKQEFDQLKEEIELMSEYFVDLKPGDRFSLTYVPGVGTKFAHNGSITGVIEGNEFSKALFSVWIGDKPFDRKLKEKIMGPQNKNKLQQETLAMRVER